MIGQNYSYKGVSFSDLLARSQRFMLSEVEFEITDDTNIYNRANYHGTYSSKTLARGRQMFFKGKIFARDEATREAKLEYLNGIIQVQPNPSQNEFYKLSWETKGGSPRRAMAKVLKTIKPKNGLSDPVIEFEFELFVENPHYYADPEKTATGVLGYYGGVVLPHTLPFTLNNVTNTITIVNNGNFDAPCKISVIGPASSVQLFNLTNGTKLRMSGTTTSLVIDNRNLTNDPKSTFTITDNTVDVRGNRMRGGPITLAPGTNIISVSDLGLNPATTVTINRYDTYS